MSTKMKLIFAMIACIAMLTSASAQVMINEVLYDTAGDDDTSIMYTEIYGPPGTNIDGWTLVGINGNGGAEYISIELEGEIPGDGYFVIGGGSVANVDQLTPHNLQNAGSASGVSCDGLDLKNASGTIVDHICYGECDGDDICVGEGGTNAPDPYPSGGVNSAIARMPDHQDTDDNAADFQATEDLTPGEPNEGEAKTRPFLSPSVKESIKPDTTEKNNGVLKYEVTNSGASPAYAVRTWYGDAKLFTAREVIVDWNDSTAYNVINPNSSASYTNILELFYSLDIPSYWPFVLTYEYRVPKLSTEESFTKEDFEVITYIYASTLVKTQSGLGTLSADEMRIRGRVDSMKVKVMHPNYEIDWFVLKSDL